MTATGVTGLRRIAPHMELADSPRSRAARFSAENIDALLAGPGRTIELAEIPTTARVTLADGSAVFVGWGPQIQQRPDSRDSGMWAHAALMDADGNLVALPDDNVVIYLDDGSFVGVAEDVRGLVAAAEQGELAHVDATRGYRDFV